MSVQDSLLPRPRLSIFLLILWLFLQNSLTFSTVFFGAILGWLIPLFCYRYWPEPQEPTGHLLFVRYMLRVFKDILLANLNVARLILGSPRKLNPAFVTYPLALENKFAITMLAGTISLTPGTVSSDISEDRRYLLIHALNVGDEEELIQGIKDRYETPLQEIFE